MYNHNYLVTYGQLYSLQLLLCFNSYTSFIVHACISTVGHNKDHLLFPVGLLRSLLLGHKPVYPHQTILTSIHYYQPICLLSVQTVVLILDQDSYVIQIKINSKQISRQLHSNTASYNYPLNCYSYACIQLSMQLSNQ